MDTARDSAWTWLAKQLGVPVLLATPARDLKGVKLPASQLDCEKLEQLSEIVGLNRVRTDSLERIAHARAGDYPGSLALHTGEIGFVPDAVIYPQTGAEIQAVVTFAAETGFPVIPWGSGAVGADCRSARTLAIDLSRMPPAMANTDFFEAGLRGFEIRHALQASGRMPVIMDDAFDCSTLGGWIATAALQHAGVRKGWLRAATVATPRGLLDIDDPDICSILIGSKGAAGIITEARILTRTLPESRETRSFLFRDFESGARVTQLVAQEEAVQVSAQLSGESEFRRAFAAQEQHWGERLGDVYRNVRGFDAKAVTLSVTFEGMQRRVDGAVTRTEIAAAQMGALFLRHGADLRGPPLKDLRTALMHRGAAAEEFLMEVRWENLPELRQRLIAALEGALRADLLHPDSRGLALTTLKSLTSETALLRLTYIFPRLLGAEMQQWEKIRQAVYAVSPRQTKARTKLRAVKRLLDPENILPAID
jgi:alkyldihydroxyacetonephosphate synthase